MHLTDGENVAVLRNRTFFAVPHAHGVTAMSGDLVLALPTLVWPVKSPGVVDYPARSSVS
jgi:hypothetical protein